MDKKKDKVINSLNHFLKKVRKYIRVEKVIFFGSRAKNKAKERSDIDVIIVSNDFEGIKFFKRSPPLYSMWDGSCDIDIICLTPKELAEKVKEIGVIREAMKGGIEI